MSNFIVEVSNNGEVIWNRGQKQGSSCTAFRKDGTLYEILAALQHATNQALFELDLTTDDVVGVQGNMNSTQKQTIWNRTLVEESIEVLEDSRAKTQDVIKRLQGFLGVNSVGPSAFEDLQYEDADLKRLNK